MAIPFTLDTLGSQAQQHALAPQPPVDRALQPAAPAMPLGVPAPPAPTQFDPRAIPPPTFSGEEGFQTVISITDLIRYMRKRWWIGALLGLPLAAAAFILLGTGPNIYQAESQLLLRLQDANVFNFDELAGTGVTELSAPMLVNNHRTEMKSRRFLEFFFGRFPEDRRAAYIEREATTLGRKDQLLKKLGLYKPGTRGEDIDIFADSIADSIEVEPLKESHILKIQFRDRDPELAAFIANRYVEDYIGYVTEQEHDLTKSVSDYLTQKSEELRKRLEESESELASYRKTEGLMADSAVEDVAGERVKLLGMAITEANMTLTRARSELESLTRARDEGRDLLNLRLVAENKDVAFARNQLDKKLAERAPLETMLGRRHPTMIALTNEIEQLRTALDGAVQAVVKMTESEVATQEQQLGEYRQQLEDARDLTLDQSSKSSQQNLLKDQVEMDRELYQKIVLRMNQADLTGQFGDNSILRVADLATVPDKPVKPNKPIAAIASTMLFGLVFFMLPLGWGFFDDHIARLFRDALDETPAENDAAPPPSQAAAPPPPQPAPGPSLPAAAAATVAARSQLAPPPAQQAPVLARLPHVTGGTTEAILSQMLMPEPAGAATALQQLTATLEQKASARGGGGVILFTSAESGEGKTLAAAALAAAFCNQNRSVFMMECNPGSPTLHQWFPHAQTHSSWAHDLESLRYGQTNLFLLPAHDLPAYATSELLDGYRAWIDRARAQVDWIILDAAPMLRSFADVAPLAPMATDVLIVSNPNVTTPAKLKAALSLLQPMMSTHALRGLILNGSAG